MTTIRNISLTVALGGFLMGFDASVISGIVSAVETEFGLSNLQVGWVVACLTLTAALAMLASGPLADRFGRRPVLRVAAIVFAVSAIGCALAPDYWTLVAARMLGGLGVGAALIVAPMYIAEIAPAAQRGRLVSLNQLNIVIGISVAYFSNYLILLASQMDASWVQTLGIDSAAWRWMLGIEAVPALVYWFALRGVPESPRWLILRKRVDEATRVLQLGRTPAEAAAELASVSASAQSGTEKRAGFMVLLSPTLRKALLLGLLVAVLQQATGINAIFFYAPMIFELSGVGTDASFMQAVLVGLTNLVFTILAISLIDRAGRRPLLLAGLGGIVVCMALLSYGFGSARYAIDETMLVALGEQGAMLQPLVGQVFQSDLAFRDAVIALIGQQEWQTLSASLMSAAIQVNSVLILLGILGFVASFAISLGPVMWVLFSELFPNHARALAISFVGLVNSGVSFAVQFIFPWELDEWGASLTFGIYAAIALLGWLLVLRLLPETKGRSLESLEQVFTSEKAT